VKVEWEDFAKRRRLKLSNFRRTLSYDEYVAWCDRRAVIPVDASVYTDTDSTKQETPLKNDHTPEIEKKPVVYVKKELNKLRKANLLNLATEHGLEVEKSMTKRQLVTLLLNMNN